MEALASKRVGQEEGRRGVREVYLGGRFVRRLIVREMGVGWFTSRVEILFEVAADMAARWYILGLVIAVGYRERRSREEVSRVRDMTRGEILGRWSDIWTCCA